MRSKKRNVRNQKRMKQWYSWIPVNYTNTKEKDANFSVNPGIFWSLGPNFYQVNFSNFTIPGVNLSVESFLIVGQFKCEEISNVIGIHLVGQDSAIKFYIDIIRFPVHLWIVQRNKKGICFVSQSQGVDVIYVAFNPMHRPKSRNYWNGLFEGRRKNDHQSQKHTEAK